MPALNICLQVANIAEASGIPYLEDLAKVAGTVFELLEKKGKNKKAAKELTESIANTIVVIDTIVRMHRERAGPYFEGICGAMAGYLEDIAQDLKNGQRKHRGIKSIINVDECRDALQAYRKRVDDLKGDFLIHLMGDCIAEVIRVHSVVQVLKDSAEMRSRNLEKAKLFGVPLGETAKAFNVQQVVDIHNLQIADPDLQHTTCDKLIVVLVQNYIWVVCLRLDGTREKEVGCKGRCGTVEVHREAETFESSRDPDMSRVKSGACGRAEMGLPNPETPGRAKLTTNGCG
ncbi:hypothetical protein EDD18DRAFT_1334596 [Armillaria luteobubalina]|uniref:Uncharacterized protein n=1 Tax=Armillaria luteobubalina TaxID=153913 RepID=A0AA39PX33_9AGAR|nr:hypothetical protein EDD18DRAFT_1334596 [Armillaria luteobubalina]